jgi:hypothetical protein
MARVRVRLALPVPRVQLAFLVLKAQLALPVPRVRLALPAGGESLVAAAREWSILATEKSTVGVMGVLVGSD